MSTPAAASDEPVPAREVIELSDGIVAHLVTHDDGWSLEIDGVRQSHIGRPGAPPTLAAARWMLAALGNDGPQTCAHLGGGMLTVPRAIAERRPDSRQVVIELEPALAELARTRFDLHLGIDVQIGDARAWLDAGTANELDAVLIDVFAGGRIPPAFTSMECFAAARAALSDTGLLIVNSVAGPELEFTRRELATVRAVFEHVAMIVQGSALHGVRFGNATLIGSAAPLSTDGIRAALADDSSRGALVTDLDRIIDGAEPVRDADQLWSPVPRLPKIDEALRLLETTRAALPRKRRRDDDGGTPAGKSC
ncbi:fused MFS/spermidine synthase [Georgenia halophila]|uniref:Fused MFS/spermidine synthase n=1 Tax=Georgenia halophila TaxID=620889 RepID=A0ABP8LIC1_9MICO